MAAGVFALTSAFSGIKSHDTCCAHCIHLHILMNCYRKCSMTWACFMLQFIKCPVRHDPRVHCSTANVCLATGWAGLISISSVSFLLLNPTNQQSVPWPDAALPLTALN
jgi:hypothetical protein